MKEGDYRVIEVMAIGRTFEEALQKALRSLDVDKGFGFGYDAWSETELRYLLETPTDDRIFALYEALKRDFSVEEIAELSGIDPFFIRKLERIVRAEADLETGTDLDPQRLKNLKRMGFADEQIARLSGRSSEAIRDLRREQGVIPTYKMVDTCAAEFEAKTPYFYSTYEDECELKPTTRKKVLIIGAGPIRIGQGIEFDYCTVHAVKALKEEGIEAQIINNNPETVSTDYDTSDKLHFEPLTLEEVLIGAIMEHLEEAGVHSGDSTCVIPPQSLSNDVIARIRDYVKRIALSLHIKGLLNIQMAVKDGVVYVLEVNPRASRTVPYVAKATGIPLAKLAAKVMLGHKLRDLNVKERVFRHVAVKEVVLPFSKFKGVDIILGHEMKSTGEVMGIDYRFDKAFFKAERAAANPLPSSCGGTVFISVCDDDKADILKIARALKDAGLAIVGTGGTVAYLKQHGIEAGEFKFIVLFPTVNLERKWKRTD